MTPPVSVVPLLSEKPLLLNVPQVRVVYQFVYVVICFPSLTIDSANIDTWNQKLPILKLNEPSNDSLYNKCTFENVKAIQ